MTSTGKKARRQFGTRFAAKKAKGGKGKTFSVVQHTVMTPEQIHQHALSVARNMGLI
jgi:hypothetical protein